MTRFAVVKRFPPPPSRGQALRGNDENNREGGFFAGMTGGKVTLRQFPRTFVNSRAPSSFPRRRESISKQRMAIRTSSGFWHLETASALDDQPLW
ncbi:MAG: hypothetical protein KGL63_07380 [Betaproteobacteria bacterium]|nr:hypothetical protein [Betaproteobacteria bacterium]